MPKRTMAKMTRGAVTAQKDAEIEALREALGDHNGRRIIRIPIESVVPLQIGRTEDGCLKLIRQPRKYFDLDELNCLAESIRDRGLNEPISVRPLEDGKYGLLDGERRWRAHQMIEEPLIDCVVFASLSDDEALEWALTTDTLKAKVSSFEQTLSVINLLGLRLGMEELGVRKTLNALNNRDSGKTKIEIADDQSNVIYGVLGSLGLKLGSLVARLPLLDLPGYLREAIIDGQLSPTNALLINRAPEKLHEQLLSKGKALSKAKLSQMISRLKDEEASVDVEKLELSEEERSLPQVVSDRWTIIKRSKFVKTGGDAKLTRKLERVNKLLAEIEEYISDQKP